MLAVVEPKRTVEVWVYLLSIALGVCLYAIFIASLTSVITEANASGRAYQSKLDIVKSYMSVSGVAFRSLGIGERVAT